MGKFCGKIPEDDSVQLRQRIGREAHRPGKTQGCLLPEEALHVVLQVIKSLDRAGAGLGQIFSVFCEKETIVVGAEQGMAQLPLQGGEGLAEGLPGDEQALRRPGEVHSLHGFQKIA